MNSQKPYRLAPLNKCSICNHTSLIPYMKVKDFLVTQNDFQLSQCNRCKMIFTNPQPEEDSVGYFYQSEEYISHTDAKSSFVDILYHKVRDYMLKKKVKIIRRYFQQNKQIRLLDYGCATGEFLQAAKRYHINGVGVEPDEKAKKRAQNKGITVVDNLNNPIFDRSQQKFDVITLWHVLEHIPNPNEQLVKISSVLNSNGILVIAVPEHKSYDAVYYKSYWAAWDVPRHVNHFSQHHLEILFSQHQFSLIDVLPLWFDAYYISLLSENIKSKNPLRYLNAFFRGSLSNLFAMQGKYPQSSRIYVFRKE